MPDLKPGKIFNFIGLLLLALTPYYILINQNKNNTQSGMNPLYLAGRKVFENSGCHSCHTRYIKMIPEEIVRYFPEDYFKINLSSFKQKFLTERLDITGPRLGPDIENITFGLYGESYIKDYIKNPGIFYNKSIMPQYSYLFNEKLRNDEIIFASGSLKFQKGYLMYNRGEALMYYLKISSGNFGGN
jgi:cbb3-type cytochrome oxidase cytochrome c subunit